MREVKYFAPGSMEEALKLLAEYGERATVLAGGTDLVPRINTYKLRPEVLLYVGGLGLDYLREDGERLAIGAATPTGKLVASPLLAGRANALPYGPRRPSEGTWPTARLRPTRRRRSSQWTPSFS